MTAAWASVDTSSGLDFFPFPFVLFLLLFFVMVSGEVDGGWLSGGVEERGEVGEQLTRIRLAVSCYKAGVVADISF